MSGQPMVGNLAWAPLPAFEEVEVLDRFNGVPTLGTFGAFGHKVLFWRAFGYVPPDDLSIWLYVPLSIEDEQRLANSAPSDLLHGLVFQSEVPRRITIGLAQSYRLDFEFSWQLPVNMPADQLIQELLRFSLSELTKSLKRALIPSRRKAVRRASKALRELAAG